MASLKAESNGHNHGRNSSRISCVALAEKYRRQLRTQYNNDFSISLEKQIQNIAHLFSSKLQTWVKQLVNKIHHD
jgi:gluconate kinase